MLLTFLFAASIGKAKIDFNHEVRPILSEHCFSCHGLDQQKGGLRLDLEQSAQEGGKSGYPAISPGNLELSHLIERITDESDEKMPPPGQNTAAPLSPKQVEILRQWVSEGGAYQKHWAYEKPQRPKLPSIPESRQAGNSVDYFILAKLEDLGMQPSPMADKARLLRRVYLDLIGLPPTLKQLDDFLTNESPDAYTVVVDQLLKSKRYGEHWARQWLDLARYADSNGFQADQLRDSWAFRDWVINAMNSDMPFDQFTIEQLAGDLLPSPTLSQKIATGFHRTPTCNVEAGVDPEENRTNQVVDRVNTTGIVWLGTSLECAQCHSHKYDPFSQEEYYQLYAFFNNTPLEVRGKGDVSFDFYGPKMDLPSDKEHSTRKAQAIRKLNAEETKLEELKKAQDKKARKRWEVTRSNLQNQNNKGNVKPSWSPVSFTHWKSSTNETFTKLNDGSLLAGGTSGEKAIYTFEAEVPSEPIAALRLEALTHESLKANGPGRNTTNGNPNFVLTELTLSLRDKDGKEHPVPLTNAKASFSQSNFPVSGLIDGGRNSRNGWAIAPEFGKNHWATFDLLNPLTIRSGEKLIFKLEHLYGGGRNVGRTLFHTSPAPTNKSIESFPANVLVALQKKEPSAKDFEVFKKHYLKSVDAIKKQQKLVNDAKKLADSIKPPSTLVMVEMEKARETNLMIRGEFLNKGKRVNYGTPAILHSWDKSLPNNRLGLARWLTSPENPLVARVTVNRWWAQFMGRGIVATEEDFGSQSEPPTHPELLDWLATEFVDSGWSMKHVHRTIVLSRTYQQSSRLTAPQLEEDPDNKYYGRGPRFRMTAEMIRDNALQISGLLSTKMHGPPIFPPQPDGLWKQVGRNEPKYAAAKNEDRFRRGIYVIWRRAAPYPSFVNFDGPDRSACHPRRSRTNTPLQALTLLNDEAYVEMALGFAAKILSQNPSASLDEKIHTAFRQALSREPRPNEVATLKELYETESKELRKNPSRVSELLDGIKGYKPSPGLDRSQLAAWFSVTNTLLNLDETVTKS